MTLRVEVLRGPAFLAPALINGDVSSFDDAGEDQRMLEAFEEYVAPGRVVSTVDDSEDCFAHLWIPGRPRYSGPVVDYVVHYDEE